MSSDRTGEALLEPLEASVALDSYFLEARSKLLDLAAILDRIGRGRDFHTGVEQDARLARIRQALEVLHEQGASRQTPPRAERVQQIFSLEYDPTWERPPREMTK